MSCFEVAIYPTNNPSLTECRVIGESSIYPKHYTSISNIQIPPHHQLTPGTHYYLQAASDASMPNPFLLTDSLAQPHSGDSDFGLATGGGDRRAPPTRPGPPQRPPPPQTGGPLAGTASPAHQPTVAAPPKSAFDDLNDTIRMALGNSGSPARNAAAAAGQGVAGVGAGQPAQVNQNFMQQASASAQQPPQPQSMYSSPAKQPASGLGLCQNHVP